MDYLNRYFLYLLALGYSTSGNISEDNTTITNYVDAMNDIANLENFKSAEDFLKQFKDLKSLKTAIAKIDAEYSDTSNPKSQKLPQDDKHRTLKGLNHFAEFIKLCNK